MEGRGGRSGALGRKLETRSVRGSGIVFPVGGWGLILDTTLLFSSVLCLFLFYRVSPEETSQSRVPLFPAQSSFSSGGPSGCPAATVRRSLRLLCKTRPMGPPVNPWLGIFLLFFRDADLHGPGCRLLEYRRQAHHSRSTEPLGSEYDAEPPDCLLPNRPPDDVPCQVLLAIHVSPSLVTELYSLLGATGSASLSTHLVWGKLSR